MHKKMAEAVIDGDRRMMARVISLIENQENGKTEILRELFPYTGKAYIIGITGAPGTGKSSLVDVLLAMLRKQGMKVGVIAVDPTSPFSGGAILGDRIRMQEHALDRGVFIRSMGTRGSLGGLCRAVKDVIQVMDAFGKDIIIIETVGVGQSEIDIIKYADTTLLVLTPAGGDGVQTIKAGIMEIADVFVVNKADLPGADRTVSEIGMMLDFGGAKHKWRPQIVRTVALDGNGTDLMYNAIVQHREYLRESDILIKTRAERVRREVTDLVEDKIKTMVWQELSRTDAYEYSVQRVLSKEMDPYTAALQLVKSIKLNSIKEEG